MAQVVEVAGGEVLCVQVFVHGEGVITPVRPAHNFPETTNRSVTLVSQSGELGVGGVEVRAFLATRAVRPFDVVLAPVTEIPTPTAVVVWRLSVYLINGYLLD